MSELQNEKPQRVLGPVHYFFITIVLGAGCLFCFKLYAFLSTIKRDEMAGFAFDPVIIYGLVAMGFLFLLAWAYLTGQFRDIEGPKYEMLERIAEQEREEAKMFRDGYTAESGGSKP